MVAYFCRFKYSQELSLRADLKWRDTCFKGQWWWRVLPD